jgi:hypothetical protein
LLLSAKNYDDNDDDSIVSYPLHVAYYDVLFLHLSIYYMAKQNCRFLLSARVTSLIIMNRMDTIYGILSDKMTLRILHAFSARFSITQKEIMISEGGSVNMNEL